MNKPILAENLSNAIRTMSSREIAELCNKEHRNVCRDIEILNETYARMGMLKIEQGYYTHPNTGLQQHREFHLTKEQSIDLVTGYNTELRIKINRRWLELENRELSKIEILQLAIESEKQKVALEQQVAVLEPKALALDTIADTSNTYTIRECAKTIGIKEKHLVNLLLEKGWCYRESSGRLQPYATKTDQNIFINRPSPIITNPNTGEEKVHLHMRVTAHGLTRITALVNQHRGG